MKNSMTVLIESIEFYFKDDISLTTEDFQTLKNCAKFVDKYTEKNGGALAGIGYFEDPYEKVDEMKVGDCTEKPPFFIHFPLEDVCAEHFPKIFNIYSILLQKDEINRDRTKTELENALKSYFHDFEEKLINCHDLNYQDVENFFNESKQQSPTM